VPRRRHRRHQDGRPLDHLRCLPRPPHRHRRHEAVTIKSRVRRGETITTVSGFSPLLADKLNALTDAGDRAHAANILDQTVIILSDTPDTDWDGEPGARNAGLSRTSYRGSAGVVTVDDVLDLADAIRAQLAA
jgi:hypothetical protein